MPHKEYSQNVASVVAAIETKITTASQSPTKWAAEVKKYGFASLGGFMMQITAWDKELSDVANVQPSAIPMNPGALSGYNLNVGLAQVNAYIANDNQAPASIGSLSSGTAPSGMTSFEESGPGGWILSKVLNPIEEGIVGVFKYLFQSSADPVGAIQSFGMALIGLASSIIGIIIVSLGAAGETAGVASALTFGLAGKLISGPLKLVVPFITPFLFMAIFGLLVAGLMLAYVIPMVPYIIYTMAVLGWIMAVMVALIGAPLWAAVHAIPTGEGAIPQEAKQGWKMLLALFVEPALLVFGFFLSIVVFQAAAWLADKTFTATAESVLTMGGTSGIGAALAGIFGSITLILIFVVLYWKIALWSFSLIMVIPNKALEWGGMQALSDYGQRNVHAEVIAGVANVHREAIKKPQQKNGNKNNNNSDTED
ncbi:membrane hypothetical protein [Acidithiobacillus ferrivorans]|uniref:Uncharacterized protein n=1 Tax=Acidithiobacillus ferrivorans TaxID=160808 RepID=A0A060UPJ8_9PROT|nr:membrane hypothetical protein [Acidithiobacillus ferrivorans]